MCAARRGHYAQLRCAETTLPEFDVTIMTVRSGTYTIRVEADDCIAARSLIQSECDTDQCHCPSDWCIDDVQSNVVGSRPSNGQER